MTDSGPAGPTDVQHAVIAGSVKLCNKLLVVGHFFLYKFNAKHWADTNYIVDD